MLPKTKRLNIREYYSLLRNNGRNIKSANSIILYRYTADQPTQANVVVPQKTTKSKPLRNRIRRKIMQAITRNWSALPKNLQILIMIHNPNFAIRSDQELTAELLQQLSQLKK